MAGRNSKLHFFINVVTVPEYRTFDDMPDRQKAAWEDMCKRSENGFDMDYKKAGIIPEFGKIACLSYSIYEYNDEIKSYYFNHEADILYSFSDVLSNLKNVVFVGHNIRSFDIPFIAKRYVINSMVIPQQLAIACDYRRGGYVIDVSDVWKFGGRTYVPLENIASALDVQGHKYDMNGSMIYDVYYNDRDIERIVKYSEDKLLSAMLVFYRINKSLSYE